MEKKNKSMDYGRCSACGSRFCLEEMLYSSFNKMKYCTNCFTPNMMKQLEKKYKKIESGDKNATV
jgi:predicted sulfurtransferase